MKTCNLQATVVDAGDRRTLRKKLTKILLTNYKSTQQNNSKIFQQHSKFWTTNYNDIAYGVLIFKSIYYYSKLVIPKSFLKPRCIKYRRICLVLTLTCIIYSWAILYSSTVIGNGIRYSLISIFRGTAIRYVNVNFKICSFCCTREETMFTTQSMQHCPLESNIFTPMLIE